MKVTVDEMIDISNRISKGTHEAFMDGVKDEKQRERKLEDTLFEAIIQYGKRTETLIEYNKEKGNNWIEIKPTREGSEGVKNIAISFEDNLKEIDHIGISTINQ